MEGGWVTIPTGGADGFISGGNLAGETLNLTGTGSANASISLADFVTTAELNTASSGLALTTTGAAGNIGLNNGSAALNINVNDGDASDTNELQTISSSNGSINVGGGGLAYDLTIGTVPGSSVIPNFVNQNIITTGNLNVGGTVTVGGTQVHPDYVFQKYFTGNSILKSDYDFLTLEEIETFVKKHHHLPGIQSADELEKQGYFDLGKSSKVNLEKIEELFLHTIEQEKKIKSLKEENQKLAEEVEAMKKDMALIKELLAQKAGK